MATAGDEVGDVALELLRVANNDPATLDHVAAPTARLGAGFSGIRWPDRQASAGAVVWCAGSSRLGATFVSAGPGPRFADMRASPSCFLEARWPRTGLRCRA